MKYCDFLSSSPSIYLINQAKGKSKLGGFLSIIYVLVMIGISIYYFDLYFSGEKFELNYRNENMKSSEELQNSIENHEVEIDIIVHKNNIPSNIKYELIKDKAFYDESNLTRCGNPYGNDFDIFCFNTTFWRDSFYIKCKDNCTDINGRPYDLFFEVWIKNLKINHHEKNPFTFVGIIGESYHVETKSNFIQNYAFFLTPVIYNSSQIFHKDLTQFVNFYLSDIQNSMESKDMDNDIMAKLSFYLSANCDIYERIYITLINTISDIGGIFASVKEFFAIVIIFYSDFENNYRITENIILKKNIYQNISQSNNKLDVNNAKSIELVEKKLLQKKIRTNSCEHFFCSFFNCGKNKNRKTMKILNICNDFVMKYLSAENIIFNNILFEKFSEENRIDISKIRIFKDIEKEMFYDDDNELLLSDI